MHVNVSRIIALEYLRVQEILKDSDKNKLLIIARDIFYNQSNVMGLNFVKEPAHFIYLSIL